MLQPARYGDIAPFVSHSEDENDDWVTDDEEEEGGDTDEESYNPSIAEGSVWYLMSNTPFGENAPRADPSHPDSQLMSDAFGLVNAMFSGLRAQNLNVNNVDMSSDDDDEAPPPPRGGKGQPPPNTKEELDTSSLINTEDATRKFRKAEKRTGELLTTRLGFFTMLS